MEFLSPAWWSALLAIILIDLVLAGDNAIVIALGKEMRHGRGLNLPIEREGRVEIILLPPASGGG